MSNTPTNISIYLLKIFINYYIDSFSPNFDKTIGINFSGIDFFIYNIKIKGSVRIKKKMKDSILIQLQLDMEENDKSYKNNKFQHQKQVFYNFL